MTTPRLDGTRLLGSQIVGSWAWDVPKNKLFASGRLSEYFGFSRDQGSSGLSPKRYLDAVHEDDRQRVKQANLKAITNGAPIFEGYRVNTLRDGVRMVLAAGECFHDAAYQPTVHTGYVLDITETGRLPELPHLVKAAREEAARTGHEFAEYLLAMLLRDLAEQG